ncbi:MAG: hypothetical protein BRD55_07495 [Bacteroidetes bacterium SW_9_63_38]|nr:MAG: hypothetical protein BRD55_07495 [Bacteroidetes bacterium SW_9_63_38]
MVLSGCDEAGSKRTSQAQQLSGTWNLCVDTGSGECSTLDDVTLHVSDGEGPKTYQLTREQNGRERTGRMELVQANVLLMSGDFLADDLAWDLDFDRPTEISGSARLTLIRTRGRNEAIRDFLDFLGATGWTGGQIQMDLRLSS